MKNLIAKKTIVIMCFFMLFTYPIANAQQMIKASEVTPAYLKILCSMSDIKITEMNDNYIKTIKQTGYVDEDQTCTKCLGTGKCK